MFEGSTNVVKFLIVVEIFVEIVETIVEIVIEILDCI